MNERKHTQGPEISAFLDGALAGKDRVRVDAHLAACPACRAESESLRQLKMTVRAAPRKRMPADLALALERRFVRSQPWWRANSRPAFWVPAGTMAAAALLAGFWMRSTGAADEVPLEPLLTAHARYSAEALVPEENLVASTYSDQLTALYANSSDAELE
ncbi:MAG TPA: hypothetical protein DCZ01_02575 [Elusimicrobia bacterium]|nr:MAG: hypothetical protein A2X37_10480 [Elusimicrobia bacterium GWA2_66_18]OGR72230.1 MAG: hypothetical protein A2X40_10055 [Elusimicrobia bacterium GWC2_65_9]HAZ07414.1 hypothetical protein [Elusimicrobiota bacterium]